MSSCISEQGIPTSSVVPHQAYAPVPLFPRHCTAPPTGGVSACYPISNLPMRLGPARIAPFTSLSILHTLLFSLLATSAQLFPVGSDGTLPPARLTTVLSAADANPALGDDSTDAPPSLSTGLIAP
jgi:hypothetical protein